MVAWSQLRLSNKASLSFGNQLAVFYHTVLHFRNFRIRILLESKATISPLAPPPGRTMERPFLFARSHPEHDRSLFTTFQLHSHCMCARTEIIKLSSRFPTLFQRPLHFGLFDLQSCQFDRPASWVDFCGPIFIERNPYYEFDEPISEKERERERFSIV